MSLTRIYQGRVTNVEVKNADAVTQKELPWLLYCSDAKTAVDLTRRLPALRKEVQDEIVERAEKSKAERRKIPKSGQLLAYEKLRDEHRKNWHAILWQHHEIFQDAVNYYFAVFAAMVPDQCEHKYWREYREVIENSWEQHEGRKDCWARPFSAACTTIGLQASASFVEFREQIFRKTGNRAIEQQRFAALNDLFRAVNQVAETNAENEEALTGVAKRVFGQEFVTLAAQHMGVPDKVTKGAQKDKANELIRSVREGSNISWEDVFAFKTHPKRKPWSRKQAAKKLNGALSDLVENLKESEIKKANAESTARSQKGRSGLASQRREIQKLLNALAASHATFNKWLSDEKTILPSDEPVRTGRGAEPLKSAMLFALQPDLIGFRELFLYFNKESKPQHYTADACSEARTAGGVDRPVLPQFLDARCDRENDPSIKHGMWPHFEKAAFIEVFNKIGQFHLTGHDFDQRLHEAEAVISAVEKEMDSEPQSKLHDIKAITEDLAEGIVAADGTERRYVIRDRTLKRWPSVRQAWQEMLETNPTASVRDLVAEKNTLQRNFREKFGSAALFEKLADEKYRNLWTTKGEDILERWADYEEALELKAHLEEGQNFSPAHATKSPRYFRWSESSNRTHLAWDGSDASGSKPFKVRVDAFDFERKVGAEFILHFTAPRLLRNNLRSDKEQLDEDNPDLVALPPALRVIIEKLNLIPDKQTFAGTSVRLAPVPGEPTNIQLVFEHAYECKTLRAEWRKRFPFEGIASRKEPDKMIGLKWARDNKPLDWQRNGHVQSLTVDLGILNAAAYQVFRAERINGTNQSKGLVHSITPVDYADQWKARSIASGVIRLSGEDAIVYRPKFRNGKAVVGSQAFREELSGSAGRNARPEETHQAEEWFKEIEKLGDNFFQRHPQSVASLSFPEQNDELLFGLSRLRAQLFRLHRWAEHIFGEIPLTVKPERRQQIEQRAQKRRADALKQISELQNDDPLWELKSLAENTKSLRAKLEQMIEDYLAKFKELLPKFSDRIVPTHEGYWQWTAIENGWHSMKLHASRPRSNVWLAGQRGLSYARLRQLKELRQFAQSLNHLCRHEFAKRRFVGRRESIPEPFEGCRQSLEDAREDRVKKIAHAIFAAALGVELDEPPADKNKQKRTKSLHGAYRCLDRGPVNFIALERLQDYRMSDRQSRRENRQIAEWRHRDIHRVLKELCDVVGIPIVYVDPQNTSRFSGKDHSIGFRAEEVYGNDPRIVGWRRVAEKEEDSELREFVEQLESLPKGKSLLRPRNGGPVFVSLAGDVSKNPNAGLFHADLNGAYRVGLRALAHPKRWDCLGFFNSERSSNGTKGEEPGTQSEKKKKRAFVIDRFGIFENAIRLDGCEYALVRGGERFWDSVRGELANERCQQINQARRVKWGLIPPSSSDEEDNIPM